MIDQAEAGGLRSAEGQPGIAMPCGRPGGLHSNTPFAMAAMFGEITGWFRRDTRTARSGGYTRARSCSCYSARRLNGWKQGRSGEVTGCRSAIGFSVHRHPRKRMLRCALNRVGDFRHRRSGSLLSAWRGLLLPDSRPWRWRKETTARFSVVRLS